MNQRVSCFQQCSEMIVCFCVRISLTASKMLESVKDLLNYNPKPYKIILEKEVYACWLVINVFLRHFIRRFLKYGNRKQIVKELKVRWLLLCTSFETTCIAYIV